MEPADDPAALLKIGLAFWQAKVLLTAIELRVFGVLAQGPRTAAALCQDLKLNGRGATDFFDALVAMSLLERNEGLYSNTRSTASFLVPDQPSYIGGALEMANDRLYSVWGHLTEALQTGEPQNEAKQDAHAYYQNLNRSEERLRTFLCGMTGLSKAAARAMALKFPWAEAGTFVDVGGAQGGLAVELAIAHSHLTGGTFELPTVSPFFKEYVGSFALQDRLHFYAGDFFADPLPSADVIIMGHVLHNWDVDRKRLLIQKAYDALPRGGSLIVYEALIDDQRNQNSFGLLMSLNMLLVTTGGSVFTGAECCSWMQTAGFGETRVEHLHGPDWMVVGVKR